MNVWEREWLSIYNLVCYFLSRFVLL
jgi:hypothetical protein